MEFFLNHWFSANMFFVLQVHTDKQNTVTLGKWDRLHLILSTAYLYQLALLVLVSQSQSVPVHDLIPPPVVVTVPARLRWSPVVPLVPPPSQGLWPASFLVTRDVLFHYCSTGKDTDQYLGLIISFHSFDLGKVNHDRVVPLCPFDVSWALEYMCLIKRHMAFMLSCF